MHFSPLYSPFAFTGIFLPLIAVAILWTLVLKGFSLWYAARGEQKWWFIALLVVNSLGILEIVYLIWFRPEQKKHYHEHPPVHHHSSGPA